MYVFVYAYSKPLGPTDPLDLEQNTFNLHRIDIESKTFLRAYNHFFKTKDNVIAFLDVAIKSYYQKLLILDQYETWKKV